MREAPCSLDHAQHRNEILTVARGRRITAVRVFGSVARGEAHSGSDIDLIVEIEPGRSILAQGEFQPEVEELHGVPVHSCPHQVGGEVGAPLPPPGRPTSWPRRCRGWSPAGYNPREPTVAGDTSQKCRCR